MMQNTFRRRRSQVARVWALASLLLSGIALAKMDDSTVNVKISGTVVANGSCTFTGTDPIAVEFGDVIINDIKDKAYKQNLPYTLVCKGDPGGKAIQMKLTGTAADFDGTLLKTDAKGLGLSLQKDDTAMALNQWVDIDPASPPKFAAVLVKQKDASFQNGQAFNGAATLIVGFN
ncbi:fimbrial protein [Serratia proteamaculans]|uniref:fimbrial protein n=1 Tax=Serratia proteamaculans TaxID=28151 RepID=UPI00217C6F9E|nr:fimbrial protein [Serratia proteamaculans]CAI0968592.1 putative minor fimbrial subunit StfF [Serratia proteamaculans]CAI1699316.1 putative minor fimbrial subunit StfF [Serratia proteamaculans]CAI1710991.1 putative minor fimbrial subunit StfF [Serratia proteamaculans]CAI2489211.1 putative minor fimbrial subunit StfF [Serratia proteamaculans]